MVACLRDQTFQVPSYMNIIHTLFSHRHYSDSENDILCIYRLCIHDIPTYLCVYMYVTA